MTNSILLKLVTALFFIISAIPKKAWSGSVGDSQGQNFNSNSETLNTSLKWCEKWQDQAVEFLVSLVENYRLRGLSYQEFVGKLTWQENELLRQNYFFQERFYQIYLEFLKRLETLSVQEKDENILLLATQIQLEDRATDLQGQTIDWLQFQLNQLTASLKQQGIVLDCDIKTKTKKNIYKDLNKEKGNGFTNNTSRKSDIKMAMEKLLSVTYQSCQVLNQKPLNKETPEVEGIRSSCCHGPGQIRSIANLRALQSTHYYLQNVSTSPQCFPIRDNPLIYDYGGRPFFSRGETGTLNFFKNLGPTKVLGYDCSALVYAVLLGGGFRLSPNKSFVASHVAGAQSAQFVNPEKRGLSCLERITLTEGSAIREGDIAAFNGHVVMVYSVGKDPFGFERNSNCETIKSSDFDFTILQSSPSKNGIGVNVYEAKDYLDESPSMEKIFLDYAKNFCYVKKKHTKVQLFRKNYAITRHKNTEVCRTEKVSYEYESCVVGTCL
ncbi:MAG: hypothetical protein L6Q37_03135 [Bdellovibrionaceae bacterium]|nr:hypothetical protein [Pseudobdellovibrionaceae bacterium]NUM60422.1 hypothetical protein [Pseudobdellovibrionaceae bacterium]